MALTTFTSGQILTAAQMNAVQANDYNQTVSTKTASYTLVAADKGTRVVMNSASATTITVNTSLFSAGDTLFLQNIGAGVCTVTAGTATVSSAGPLAIPQNGSGLLYFTSAGVSIYYPSAVTATSSGLTLVKTQTIGSAVSSVEVTGAFSATYDNYRVLVTGGAGSTNANLSIRLGATATGYYQAGLIANYSGGTFSNDNANNAAQFIAGGSTTNGVVAEYNFFQPNLASRTGYSFTCPFMTTDVMKFTAGWLNDATQYTAFTITFSAGTFTGGTIRVYGYANS
jgi:hypothetical protein